MPDTPAAPEFGTLTLEQYQRTRDNGDGTAAAVPASPATGSTTTTRRRRSTSTPARRCAKCGRSMGDSRARHCGPCKLALRRAREAKQRARSVEQQASQPETPPPAPPVWDLEAPPIPPAVLDPPADPLSPLLELLGTLPAGVATVGLANGWTLSRPDAATK